MRPVYPSFHLCPHWRHTLLSFLCPQNPQSTPKGPVRSTPRHPFPAPKPLVTAWMDVDPHLGQCAGCPWTGPTSGVTWLPAPPSGALPASVFCVASRQAARMRSRNPVGALPAAESSVATVPPLPDAGAVTFGRGGTGGGFWLLGCAGAGGGAACGPVWNTCPQAGQRTRLPKNSGGTFNALPHFGHGAVTAMALLLSCREPKNGLYAAAEPGVLRPAPLSG